MDVFLLHFAKFLSAYLPSFLPVPQTNKMKLPTPCKNRNHLIWVIPAQTYLHDVCICISPFVGIIQIRYSGRRSHLPLSLYFKLPSASYICFRVVTVLLYRTLFLKSTSSQNFPARFRYFFPFFELSQVYRISASAFNPFLLPIPIFFPRNGSFLCRLALLSDIVR